jgi:hypothetical protein
VYTFEEANLTVRILCFHKISEIVAMLQMKVKIILNVVFYGGNIRSYEREIRFRFVKVNRKRYVFYC